VETKRAAFILSNYPGLWAQLQQAREDILHAYRQEAYVIVRGGNSPGDPTGRKTRKLLELGERQADMLAVPEFMETLSIRERKLVTLVWRYGTYSNSWKLIQKNFGNCTDCRVVWEKIVRKFAAYLENRKACAGNV
jgi:hypothetical protein